MTEDRREKSDDRCKKIDNVLALFLKADVNIKTSKHAGVLSLFNKEFVHPGRLDKNYSKMLHKLFDAWQEGDYKELVMITTQDTAEYIRIAKEFLNGIKAFMGKIP